MHTAKIQIRLYLHNLISLNFLPEEMLNPSLPIEHPSKTDQTVQIYVEANLKSSMGVHGNLYLLLNIGSYTQVPLKQLPLDTVHLAFIIKLCNEELYISFLLDEIKVGNRPVNKHIDQTSGHYWF